MIKKLSISQNKWWPNGESSEKRRKIDDIEIVRECRIQGIGSWKMNMNDICHCY
jgi:hypothetical protein